MSCVELKRWLGVESTFVLKGYAHMFPKKQLEAVLRARHKKIAGHWVVMETDMPYTRKVKVDGAWQDGEDETVRVIAIAYAWSAKNITYMVSTVGNTTADADPYVTNYTDEYGVAQEKRMSRPKLCAFLYKLLPLIDEHNKQRQHELAVERAWQTKDPYFRLLETVFGMAVVDLHRLYT